MLFRRKVGGLSERRYVVEIARPVPGDDVEAAAKYVANRLGIDVARIRTLLGGRTGAVTRELIAEKAEAIAKVFGEAGVMVTVVERALDEHVHSGGSTADQEVQESGNDFEYQGPAVDTAGAPPWAGPEPGPQAGAGAFETETEAEDDETGSTLDLRPSSTRWVPSPHAITDEPDYYDDRDDAIEEDLGAIFGERPTGGQDTDARPPRDGRAESAASTEPDVPTTGEAPDPGSPVRESPDRWRPERRDSAFDERLDSDFTDDDDRLGGQWRAPERSPFGDYDAAPNDRPQLRVYLIWALVLSVVLLAVLQFVYALNARGAVGSVSYDDGLAPYRSGDFVAARGIWEDAAGRGDARAQYMLGYLVQNGLGQPWSNRQAAEWYDQAAEQDLPEAQTALAQLYLEGLGVPPDAERGLELLRSAAAAGYPAALYRYGELLFHGRWIPQDFAGALAAFEAAAAGGSLEAADFVGLARFLDDRGAQQ